MLECWGAGVLGAGCFGLAAVWKAKRELRKEKKKGTGKLCLECWDDAGCWGAWVLGVLGVLAGVLGCWGAGCWGTRVLGAGGAGGAVWGAGVLGCWVLGY